MPAPKLAVALHIYYEDMWPMIAAYLRNIPPGFDLFVTCRDEIAPGLEGAVFADFPKAEVIALPNIGMDVIPFIQLCRLRGLHRYRAVLKLHTKNRKSDLRRQQGDLMFEGLCGTPELVAEILDVFDRDHNAGMVGGAFQVRSANALMYGNRAKVADLMHLLGMQVFDWPFFTGTMFWIAGPLLAGLAEHADALTEAASAEAAVGSGKDGTTAHALERMFGGLPKAARRSTYVTDRCDASGKRHLVVPIEMHGPCNDWRYLQSESTDAVARVAGAAKGCDAIRKSGLFDAAHYARTSARVVVPGMDPIYHFYLFGDLFGSDPSPLFNVNFYLAHRPDVSRRKLCSFHHYIQFGSKEDVPALPTMALWIAAAAKKGLFNAQFYHDTYPDVDRTGLSPQEHYEKIGRFLGRRTSRSLDMAEIPTLGHTVAPENRLAYYMAHIQRDEGLLYDAITKASSEGDYEFVATCANLLSSRFGVTPAVLEGEATHATINSDWDAAAAIWETYWQKRKIEAQPNRHRRTITKIDRPTRRNAEAFEPVAPGGGARAGLRICIYTTLFGDIDDLVPVIAPVEGVDYICFTDRPRAECGWRQVICDPGMESPNLNAKTFKILPHKHLAEYDYSMFVDANTLFLGNVERLIEICLQGGDWVMFQHPLRDDVYLEGCAIIGHLRHAPEKILAQIRHYAEQGLPRESGMIEASFIWRRHAAADVASFMEAWWQEITTRSSRDQLSLGYLLWKTGQKPKVLPEIVGTSRANRFFFKLPHRDGKNLHQPPRRIAARGIDFVFAPEHRATGSTFLRGEQLSALVAANQPGREVRFTPDTDQQGRILVLTKGFLKTTAPEVLERMARDNVLIADFVDEPPNPALVEHVDALMASSLLGYRDYMMRFPETQAFHVTHHVDLRIARPEAPRRDFAAGYFGELVNTVIDDDISRQVAFNLVDTSKQSDDWLKQIGGFSFHYALRRSRGIDGAKPFLKGFVAAHCAANMMIQSNAGDAGYYLGDDYPYLLPEGCTNAEILEALRFARESFGGPDWQRGMDIMRHVRARSDRAHVTGEFDRMIAQF
ncbi:rhamnan synthesis F family protein [Falsirhodobacter xinxiangensis]|uniref:rhamnan synthesis F family protein n=1 Tax=Falsirhodobacter xinxiangensis TaxID=2530049 RepID=UPI00145A6438|nr:rhamnan synthesis F family protein [Rhodobacter xinxiangensis]